MTCGLLMRASPCSFPLQYLFLNLVVFGVSRRCHKAVFQSVIYFVGCHTTALNPDPPVTYHRAYAQSTAGPFNVINRLRRTVWSGTDRLIPAHPATFACVCCVAQVGWQGVTLGFQGASSSEIILESVLGARSRVHFACFLLCCKVACQGRLPAD